MVQFTSGEGSENMLPMQEHSFFLILVHFETEFIKKIGLTIKTNVVRGLVAQGKNMSWPGGWMSTATKIGYMA